MQVTLTLPPDLITALVTRLTEGIRRELAAKASPQAPQRTNALLTVKAVAGRLKLHEKTVIRYIREGRINASNHGTSARPRYRVAESDCEAFYKANRTR